MIQFPGPSVVVDLHQPRGLAEPAGLGPARGAGEEEDEEDKGGRARRPGPDDDPRPVAAGRHDHGRLAFQPLGEFLGEGLRGGTAVPGILLQGLEADLLKGGVRGRLAFRPEDARWRGYRFPQHLHDDFLASLPAEGRTAGERLVEHDSERVDVGAPVRVLRAPSLLGAHVGGRPRHLACGQDVPHRAFGQAEVGDVGLVLPVHQDVGGLEVAVDEAFLVGVVDGERHVPEEPHLLAEGGRDRLPPFRKLAALDVLHGDVAAALDRAGLVNGDDVGMLGDAGAQAGLLQEPLLLQGRHVGVLAGDGDQHLEGDLAVESRVDRLVDHSHAAAADLAEDLVLPDRRRLGRGGLGGLRGLGRCRGPGPRLLLVEEHLQLAVGDVSLGEQDVADLPGGGPPALEVAGLLREGLPELFGGDEAPVQGQLAEQDPRFLQVVV